MDISWAKSDVFIWSSVEPSIGIISGCLPTLRPLLMHISNACSSRLPSSRKSSDHSRSYPSSPTALETISKKRTRKISKKDDLEGTIAEGGRRESKSWIRGRHNQEHSRTWRPDEDEMCLTTTTVHSENKQVGLEEFFRGSDDSRGITMTREFEWDEAKRT